MSVVMMNRYNGGSPNEVVPLVKEWKETLEKNGAESVKAQPVLYWPVCWPVAVRCALFRLGCLREIPRCFECAGRRHQI